jgi:hypothetical protein
MVGSCGSSSAIASLSDFGSTISNGITGRFSRQFLDVSVRRHAQHVIGDLGAGADPDIRRGHRLLDDALVEMRAAMVAENMGMAGDVDDAQLVFSGARDSE